MENNPFEPSTNLLGTPCLMLRAPHCRDSTGSNPCVTFLESLRVLVSVAGVRATPFAGKGSLQQGRVSSVQDSSMNWMIYGDTVNS